MFNARIRKTGNSFAVTIPSSIMIDYNEGDLVKVEIKKKEVVKNGNTAEVETGEA